MKNGWASSRESSNHDARNRKGAIPSLLVLMFTIAFALPDEWNIAEMVLQPIVKGICALPNSDVSCTFGNLFTGILPLLAILAIIVEVIWICKQWRRGRYF